MEIQGAFEHGMPLISVHVAGEEFRAILDTGFDGYVMLPREEIARLNLRELGKTMYRTADGQTHEGRVYRGQIKWLGMTNDAAIDSTDGDFALVGMKLLQPLRLVMEPSLQVLTLSTPALS